MKAIVCRFGPVKYILVRYLSKYSPKLASILPLAKLQNIQEPKLKNQDWVKIRSKMSGICGSDIHLLKASESYSLEPYCSKEFVLGHENYGIIEEVGSNIKDLKKGDRVVVQPFLSCNSRNLPLCKHCKEGEYTLCSNVNEGNLAPGLHIGLNKDTSGGWADYFIAHKETIFKIPDEISDKEAVMVDSFACTLHAVNRNPPQENQNILIYGSGTIGLLILQSLRALGYQNQVIIAYTREFQKDHAKKIGANNFINIRKEDIFQKISQLTGSKIYKTTIGKDSMEGGVDLIYECVGSGDTINNSLRFLKPKGRLVLVATSADVKIDLAPVWFRELKIIGTNEQSTEKINNQTLPSYQLAINLIKNKKVDLGKFITHVFPLKNFKEALKVATKKSKYPSLKVALKID